MDLIDFSRQIEDHRDNRNISHSVETIVFITLCAVICGAESWNEIEQFGRSKEAYFMKRLSDFNGIPSHDTFNRFFSAIDVGYFERRFRCWVRDLYKEYKGVVAIDGKTMRGSSERTSGGNGVKTKLHIVSAFAASNGISLGQVKVDDKSNEITAIPELIEALDLTECIVTIDAMGCQKAIAEKIIEADADYILAVKGNHAKLHKELINHFDYADATLKKGRTLPKTRWAFHTTEKKAHGNIEIRRCIAYSNGAMDITMCKNWKGAQTVARIEAERINCLTGEVTIEKRYYITSLEINPELIASSVRTHWSIENNLHWQLDVSFSEDKSSKTKNAAINFSLINKMALAILKKDKKKASIVAKRKIAGWNELYLDKLLQIEKR